MTLALLKISTKCLFIFLLFFSLQLTAQEKQKAPFWSKVKFGGGIGLSFGDGFFSGTLAPSAIYNVNKTVALGVGLNGTYNKQKNVYNSTVLGGSLLSLVNVLNGFQLSAEFEALNVNRKYENNLQLQDENYTYPALFLGAGYRNGGVTFGLRYDVLYDKDKSIYASALLPFVRVYF
jgi:hypothetical protein